MWCIVDRAGVGQCMVGSSFPIGGNRGISVAVQGRRWKDECVEERKPKVSRDMRHKKADASPGAIAHIRNLIGVFSTVYGSTG